MRRFRPLIREIHGQLMDGVRGGEKTPGEFRTSQNWIDPAGAPLARATFVPPPVHDMNVARGDLEQFLHDESTPAFVDFALVHAKFETVFEPKKASDDYGYERKTRPEAINARS